MSAAQHWICWNALEQRLHTLATYNREHSNCITQLPVGTLCVCGCHFRVRLDVETPRRAVVKPAKRATLGYRGVQREPHGKPVWPRNARFITRSRAITFGETQLGPAKRKPAYAPLQLSRGARLTANDNGMRYLECSPPPRRDSLPPPPMTRDRPSSRVPRGAPSTVGVCVAGAARWRDPASGAPIGALGVLPRPCRLHSASSSNKEVFVLGEYRVAAVTRVVIAVTDRC